MGTVTMICRKTLAAAGIVAHFCVPSRCYQVLLLTLKISSWRSTKCPSSGRTPAVAVTPRPTHTSGRSRRPLSTRSRFCRVKVEPHKCNAFLCLHRPPEQVINTSARSTSEMTPLSYHKSRRWRQGGMHVCSEVISAGSGDKQAAATHGLVSHIHTTVSNECKFVFSSNKQLTLNSTQLLPGHQLLGSGAGSVRGK